MTDALINIHVIIAQIISCILCAILIFVVFSQTIYYLCCHKLFHYFYAKDESNLQRFQFPNDKKSSLKRIVSDKPKYDDIHLFFRITTTICLLFCVSASISSIIAMMDLLLNGSLSHHSKYIRITCFVSWLFSHYSMSSVFVGRLYVSFKDSIFQYPLHVIRILSISLAALPLLLLMSLLFWILDKNNISLLCFISFIAMDVAFSIILTSLFIQKLYQLIRGRIITRTKHIDIEVADHPSASSAALRVKSDAKRGDIQRPSKTNDASQHTLTTAETSKKETCASTIVPITPQVPSIADFTLPDFATSNDINDSDPNNDIKRTSNSNESYIAHTETEVKEEEDECNNIQKPRPTLTITAIMDDLTVFPVDTPVTVDQDDACVEDVTVIVDYGELDVPVSIKGRSSDKDITSRDTPRSTNSLTPAAHSPKTVRFSNTAKMRETESTNSRARKYVRRARSISRSISKIKISSPTHSKAFIKAKQKLDQQQLELIDNMTRSGLLLLMSSITSLTCLIYIMITFQHYESSEDYYGEDNSVNTAYYYLYCNMGIAAFLNGLSLYLSFAFAQWFYRKLCNKVHKWVEAICVILIVKQLKQNNPNISNAP